MRIIRDLQVSKYHKVRLIFLNEIGNPPETQQDRGERSENFKPLKVANVGFAGRACVSELLSQRGKGFCDCNLQIC